MFRSSDINHVNLEYVLHSDNSRLLQVMENEAIDFEMDSIDLDST